MWHYGEDEETANSILSEILSGKRRMISTVYEEYCEIADPKPGDINVITDWAGTPKCVIRTTDAQIMDYGDVPFEIASSNMATQRWRTGRSAKERFFRQTTQM